MRILKEAEGMRKRGHEIIFAIAKGGGLVQKARDKGFLVYELNFKKVAWIHTIFSLFFLLHRHDVDIVNTHSSLDAWAAGMAARMAKKKIIRTRHLSTAIRKGLNSVFLYQFLCDFVVTTSSSIIGPICEQAGISPKTCRCIPTGINPKEIAPTDDEVQEFRKKWGLSEKDCLVGTVCFVRSWKGIQDFLEAAHLLRHVEDLKWIIVGGGYLQEHKEMAKKKGFCGSVIFTGHLDNPFAAIGALDIFALLSTASEGISQASLQAGFLQKPLITTPIGGLPEVCIEGKTGLQVPVFSAKKVVEAVLLLKENAEKRREMGLYAKQLVMEKFTQEEMLDNMEAVYRTLLPNIVRSQSDAISGS